MEVVVSESSPCFAPGPPLCSTCATPSSSPFPSSRTCCATLALGAAHLSRICIIFPALEHLSLADCALRWVVSVEARVASYPTMHCFPSPYARPYPTTSTAREDTSSDPAPTAGNDLGSCQRPPLITTSRDSASATLPHVSVPGPHQSILFPTFGALTGIFWPL